MNKIKKSESNKNHPFISVIITTYNYEKYIGEAIQSVLKQAYTPLEIIVIDDGSTDNTKTVLTEYEQQIRYFYQENQGVAAALNKGLTEAKGVFIAILDADDLWLPNKLSMQIEAFEQHPTIEMVFGHLVSFFSPELSADECEEFESPKGPKLGFHKNCLLAKKEVFKKVGQFNVNFKFSDFVWWFEQAKKAKIPYLMLPEVVAKRRIHTQNMTIVHEKQNQMELLKIIWERKRMSNA